jgi:hypothetical protein
MGGPRAGALRTISGAFGGWRTHIYTGSMRWEHSGGRWVWYVRWDGWF